MTTEITTKAARCPKCKKYHLIASIESFDRDKDTRKNFAKMAMDGFEILNTTTADAKENFDYCQ